MSRFGEIEKGIGSHLRDGGDYVRWNAVNGNGKRKGKWKENACYASIMKSLGKWKITCINFPVEKVGKSRRHNRLSKAEFALFINLFKETGILPSEIEIAKTKRGNEMIIPNAGWDDATVFIALCLYRYSDWRMRAVAVALKLYQESGLPWLQCWHYVMTYKGVSTCHGFMAFDKTRASGLNAATGMTLCQFGARSLEERKTSIEGFRVASPYSVGVSNYLHNECVRLSGNEIQKTGWGNHKVSLYCFKDVEDILDPHYSPLYTDPTLGSEDLKRIMESR